jgi:hypothetical protein
MGVLENYLSGLAWNHNPPDFSLPNSQNYRHEPPMPGFFLIIALLSNYSHFTQFNHLKYNPMAFSLGNTVLGNFTAITCKSPVPFDIYLHPLRPRQSVIYILLYAFAYSEHLI